MIAAKGLTMVRFKVALRSAHSLTMISITVAFRRERLALRTRRVVVWRAGSHSGEPASHFCGRQSRNCTFLLKSVVHAVHVWLRGQRSPRISDHASGHRRGERRGGRGMSFGFEPRRASFGALRMERLIL